MEIDILKQRSSMIYDSFTSKGGHEASVANCKVIGSLLTGKDGHWESLENS